MPTDPDGPDRAADARGSGRYDDPGAGADLALDAFVEPYVEPDPVGAEELRAHHVTAVLVAHDGQRWLPRALAALAACDPAPARVVAVDTGSRDDSPRLLAEALGRDTVLRLPAGTGFGAALAAGLAAAPAPDDGRTPWVWVLHDDCAPEPDALCRLLEGAVRRPDAGILGPKVLGWYDDRQLLELGVSVTGGGRRHTGLERREYDQGQHDRIRDVLAVGSAGMLVRRDVWAELGGIDPRLGVFRDDLDLGWRSNLAGHPVVVCPDAVVHHAEAAAHGRRRLGAARRRPHLVDRRNALYVLLANASRWTLPVVLVRVLLGGLLRAAGFFFGKQPALAVEELAAVLSAVGRPDRLLRARRERARTRRVPDRELRALFPPRGLSLRHAAETLLSLLAGTGGGHDLPSARRRAAAAGAGDEEDEPPDPEGALLRLLTRPPVLLVAVLAVLTLVAARDLLGAGRLSGGALLPAQDTVSALWGTYTRSWHGVGLGSPTAAPPYLAVVAALASVLRSPSLAVDVLLLGSVPLAGLTGYLLARRLVAGRWLRVWAAAVYGLLPATTGAVAAGRLGTAAAVVLTPLVALAAIRTLGTPYRPGPFRAAWSAGLLLAVTAAFVPLAWVAAAVLALVALPVYRSRAATVRLVVVVAVAPVVLWPWTAEVLARPVLLVTEAGTPGPDLSVDRLPAWAVLLQHAGGPGSAPVWLGLGVLLAGYAALLGRDRRGAVLAAWAVASTGLVLGLAVSRLAVTGPTVQTAVSGWPGYAVCLLAGGLLAAAVLGADGLRDRLAGAAFGWRQPLAVTVLSLAAATPVAGAAWWAVRGADDPLERRDPAVLPAYVVDEGRRPERVRTLVLRPAADGLVTYALLRDAGPRLGDAETGPPARTYEVLDRLVGDLVSGRGAVGAEQLATFAARYVYLPAPAGPALAEALDAAPGLSRASAPEGAVMFRVEDTVGRVVVRDPAREPQRDTLVVGSGPVEARGPVPAGSDRRVLALAENADPGWGATLAGAALDPQTLDGWAQGFAVPAGAGLVVLEHEGRQRAGWLVLQLLVVVVAVVLALPGIRRDPRSVDDASDLQDVPDPDREAAAAGAVARWVPQVPSVPGVQPLPSAPAQGRRAAGRRAGGRRARGRRARPRGRRERDR